MGIPRVVIVLFNNDTYPNDCHNSRGLLTDGHAGMNTLGTFVAYQCVPAGQSGRLFS